MGSDGSWLREPVVLDISETGAGPDVLKTPELFLWLFRIGLLFRDGLVRLEGATVGMPV